MSALLASLSTRTPATGSAAHPNVQNLATSHVILISSPWVVMSSNSTIRLMFTLMMVSIEQ
jgi:hypothetical protein